MFQENEDEIMKASSICSDGSSCRHMFASVVRAKKPGSHVKNLHWFHILLLVVLLAAQASCNETSAAPSPFSITTTNAQMSVYYFVVVTVDVNGQKNESEIIAWLSQVFQNELQSCVSPNHEETTASPTSPQTTSASTSDETTLMTTATTTPVLESTNTTTPATTLSESTNTTTPATTLSESTNTTTPATPVLESTNTTTPATTLSESTNTTTPATTLSESTNTTTPATPVLESTNTTTPATTLSESTNTTTPATTPVLESTNTTTPAITPVLESTNTTTPATTPLLESTNTTTPATTLSESTNTTTPATTPVLESTNTTTPATPLLESTNTTTPATTPVSESTNTTTPAITLSESTNTTTPATPVLESTNTTTPATTLSESTNTTTPATTPVLESTNTTTPATPVLESTNTTTPATTLSESTNTTTPATTLSESTNTTTPATPVLESTNTTTPATTLSESTNTTTPATTPVLESTNTTTPAITPVLESTNTTTPATTPLLESTNTTTPATTPVLESTNKTTPATTPVLESTNTTTPATPLLESTNTTTPATTPLLESTNTTTPATTPVLESTNTTTPATTPLLESTNTTTPATTTALKSTTRTTPATTALKSTTRTTLATTALKSTTRTTLATTALKSTSTTTPATTTTATLLNSNNGKDKTTKRQSNNGRVRREIRDPVTQTSRDNTTGLFQGIDVSCAMKTAIIHTNCSVTLRLKQRVPSCCILRTLCAASNTSSDIRVVGKSAEGMSPLQNECNSNIQELNSCTYTGPTGASCEESRTAYVVPQRNSTHCGAVKENNTCSCSAYCGGTDAYYTFQLSTQNSKMNLSNLISIISKLKQQKNCASSSDVSCPLSNIASECKDFNVECGSTATNCKVILGFFHEVPICNVSAAVMNLFQSEKKISFNGQVTRAAICGNSIVSDHPLTSNFRWTTVNLTSASFCTTIEDSDILTCQNGINVLVQLEEQCAVGPSTTPGPNVTIAQPNSTTSSVNVTIAQPNSTTSSVNVTIAQPNTTTSSANGTIAQPNTTTSSVNVTIAQPNTTTSSVNGTIAQPNTTTSSVNGTSSPLNTTAQAMNATTTAAAAESQANTLLELTRDVSKLNSSQVDQLVSQLENLLSGPNVSLALGNTSIHIVSNLLGASAEVLSDSSNRIIGIVDTVGLKLVLDGEPQTLLSPAVALSVQPADGTNFQETFFSISDPSNVQVRGDPRLRRSLRADSSIPQGSIRLPPSLTQDLTDEQQQLATRVQFNFYQESTVYQDRSLGNRKLNSGILGASVANLSIRELRDDVVIHLRNSEPVPANFVATCVFWDFTLNDESGGWNQKGCFVRNSTDNETVCGCNHLTSFAILLDLSRELEISREQATILTFITYIGCGISAIFLSITLLTYLAFGKLRKDIPSKILIQLCVALLLLNLVFLVDAWLALYPDAVGLCISTAWFLHYFLLVTFTWMGLEAVHMYLALVKVFNTHISRYMLKFSLIGWGVPMIVVIIVIAIDKDNYGLVSYGRFSDGTSDDFCWLKNDIAFYVAVVAYFCIVFLFNLVMFVVVLVQLCRIKRQNPHNVQHRTMLQDVRSVAGIMILLGLTWGFAFFAWGPLNLPFMYLFAIFNSLQGFFIFVLYCAIKENVRRQWRTYLCCGRMRLAENSEWSRTATQKTAKKSSETRITSLRSSESSKSNNSSSSSSFLVSDSSEQINGIGNPFEDRTITADEDPSGDVVLNEINSQYRNQQAP
ncbi:adhesion G-protein coupled receptor G2 [Cebidichthys violaceus]|uniref:adhesion G-protein coupled receptor G2 n=1 Tax=Cebidichthys violaceus TaxID=271503 RepID=UPI0035CBC27F